MATIESVRQDDAIAKSPEVNKRVRSATTVWKKFTTAFLPHIPLPSQAMKIITMVHIVLAILFWMTVPESTFPGPIAIANAFVRLWKEEALGREILTSLTLNFQMILLLIPIGIAAIIARSVSATKGLVTAIGNFRFLSTVGITLIVTLLTNGAHSLKLTILVIFVGAYFITGLSRMIDAVPQAERDYVRTLGMSEWQAMYEVDLRGRLSDFVELLRQNQAMGWMMLTAVEGIAKSEGGVGTLLLSQQRTWALVDVYAIQATLWVLGLLIDHLFVRLRKTIPWSDLRATRR